MIERDRLAEAGIESDFKADDMPMLNDRDRHASCWSA